LETCRFQRTAMILRLRHTASQLEEFSQSFRLFDQIIHPGEAGESEAGVPSTIEELRPSWVPPILYFDRTEILSRAEARRRLSLPTNRRIVYVQLGSGNMDNAVTWTGQVLERLSRYQDVAVVLAESPIAQHEVEPPAGVHLIRQYPNARFFDAFDFAISAAGYNTVHELLFYGVPAILIPMKRLTDDQEARARAVERAEAAMVVTRPEQLTDALERLMDGDTLTRLRTAAERLIPTNGADEAARLICDQRWACLGTAETPVGRPSFDPGP
jgi:UDP-N-acetylglucosamine--N-acetylmuramyl-(pentapeptide) pyrophosphoryl-undecaprenol N-acetylglucosamine transferase